MSRSVCVRVGKGVSIGEFVGVCVRDGTGVDALRVGVGVAAATVGVGVRITVAFTVTGVGEGGDWGTGWLQQVIKRPSSVAQKPRAK